MRRVAFRLAALPLMGGALMLLAGSAIGQELSPPAIFPMALGNTWIYTGTIRWTPAGSNDVLEKEIEWTMEIIDGIERHALRAAILDGHPSDLAWYEEDRERRRHLVVAIGEGQTDPCPIIASSSTSDVGMTSYVYGHHGTGSEVDVRLTEAKLEPQ